MKMRLAGHFTDSEKENTLSFLSRRTGLLLNMNYSRYNTTLPANFAYTSSSQILFTLCPFSSQLPYTILHDISPVLLKVPANLCGYSFDTSDMPSPEAAHTEQPDIPRNILPEPDRHPRRQAPQGQHRLCRQVWPMRSV